MSKREIKKLEAKIDSMLDDDQQSMILEARMNFFKAQLDETHKNIIHTNNSALEKEYEWVKWMLVIASGVFSVIISQLARMPVIHTQQLFIMKIAITTNAIGIILGAIFLYRDFSTERKLMGKLYLNRLNLIVNGSDTYSNLISSGPLRLFSVCKHLSVVCLLVTILIWVWFIWEM